ncbi:MAG: sulfatase-like hydrolase/transferase, partial [Pirellulales bacterium]|nr:sulfatase-like hydrolase/transferase [Pirellulales bacterium]
MLLQSKKAVGGIILGLLSACLMPACDAGKPNVIVFLVDDMGPLDTSVPFMTDEQGTPKKYPLNDFYRTPGMERLAKTGIRFNTFYCMSVCSPTRTSLLTGQNAARHHVTQWIRSEDNNRGPNGPPDWRWVGVQDPSVTLPGVLRTQGYKTIFIGKAHFGPCGQPSEWPDQLGFDVNIAGCSWGQPGSYYGQDGYGHIKGNKKRAVPHLETYHGTDTFLSEALTIEAKKQISQAVDEGAPFFLDFAHYAVHAPFQSDPRFAGHYADSGKPKNAQAYATL